MWVQCTCGNRIKDISDGLPHKAHYISDQDWFDVLDRIDYAIESPEENREDLCREIRSFLCKKTKEMYQCTECGKLYVDDKNRELREFIPKNNIGTEVFRSR